MTGAVANWLLLIISAWATSASMLCLWATWMMQFVCYVPLLYLLITNRRLSACTGAVWGICFFSLHLISLAHVVLVHGQGAVRLLAYLLLVVYLSLYSMLWHFSLAIVQRCVQHDVLRLLCAIGVTLIYYDLLFYHAFFIFGVHTGYCLALPTVALYWCDAWIVHLLSIHPLFLLAIMLGLNAATAFCIKRRWYCATIGLLAGAVCIFLPATDTQMSPLATHLYETVAYCAPVEQDDPLQMADKLANRIYHLLTHHPEIETIVMPESSIGYCIDEHPWIIEYLQRNTMSSQHRLVTGTFRTDGAQLRNSILFATDNCIRAYYDKIIPLPFTEWLPWPWNTIGITKELFLSGKKPICGLVRSACAEIIRPTTDGSLYQLTEHVAVQPFICSDLFFNTGINGADESSMVLFCVKDSWFDSYYKRLLFCYASMIAAHWQRPLLYVSYDGAYLMQKGYAVHTLRTATCVH